MYAFTSAPLPVVDGERIGTLCVLDRVARARTRRVQRIEQLQNWLAGLASEPAHSQAKAHCSGAMRQMALDREESARGGRFRAGSRVAVELDMEQANGGAASNATPACRYCSASLPANRLWRVQGFLPRHRPARRTAVNTKFRQTRWRSRTTISANTGSATSELTALRCRARAGVIERDAEGQAATGLRRELRHHRAQDRRGAASACCCASSTTA